MAPEGTRIGVERTVPADISAGELIERLGRFQGSPGEFLANLLAVQCLLASADEGAILRLGAEGQGELIAIFPRLPEGQQPPGWLVQAMEAAGAVVSGGSTLIRPYRGPHDLYGQPAGRYLVMLPLARGHSVAGVAAFVVKAADPTALADSRDKLELTASLLVLYETQLTLQRRHADLKRLRMATEVLAAVNQHDRFHGAAMALCNEIASRWSCERVSLGFLKGRYVHLKALSHTEKFSRKMKIVQNLEAAMEECIDQDVEVVYPPPEGATFVSRCAADLSRHHGPTAIVSLPLRKAGDPVAVLTAERPASAPPMLEEVESLRLTCDLCATRLAGLHESDRWFGARAATAVRKGVGALLGAKHTWLKAAAIGILAAAALMVFLKGDYTVSSSYSLEAPQMQVVAAPFDGKIEAVPVGPGDKVVAGQTVLGRMETYELRLRLAKAIAERRGYLTEATAAREKNKIADAQVAEADAERTAAEIDLLKYLIDDKAVLRAPATGTIVTHKLEFRVGTTVKTGELLFEIAPAEPLRADLLVGEDQIADVREDQPGELRDPSSPDRRVSFTVERISPVAEVVNGQNIFKVRARLAGAEPWMRQGIQGEARVTVDRRPYIELWTRRLVNWVRMKLWL